jgi:hypothetical protein
MNFVSQVVCLCFIAPCAENICLFWLQTARWKNDITGLQASWMLVLLVESLSTTATGDQHMKQDYEMHPAVQKATRWAGHNNAWLSVAALCRCNVHSSHNAKLQLQYSWWFSPFLYFKHCETLLLLSKLLHLVCFSSAAKSSCLRTPTKGSNPENSTSFTLSLAFANESLWITCETQHLYDCWVTNVSRLSLCLDSQGVDSMQQQNLLSRPASWTWSTSCTLFSTFLRLTPYDCTCVRGYMRRQEQDKWKHTGFAFLTATTE